MTATSVPGLTGAADARQLPDGSQTGVVRVSSNRAGAAAVNVVPDGPAAAPGAKNPCTSTTVCIGCERNRQNRPLASSATTERFDTVAAAIVLPFDVARGPAGAAPHESAVTYPSAVAPVIAMLTSAAVAPFGAFVSITKRAPAAGTAPGARQVLDGAPDVSTVGRHEPPRLRVAILLASAGDPWNSKCVASRPTLDFTSAGDEHPPL